MLMLSVGLPAAASAATVSTSTNLPTTSPAPAPVAPLTARAYSSPAQPAVSVPSSTGTGAAKAGAAPAAAATPADLPPAIPAVLASALAQAKSTRKAVLVDQSERQQHFANPDGTQTSVVTPVPTRVKDSSGTWHDIDLTLAPALDGTLGGKTTGAGLRLAPTADGAVRIPTPAGDIVAVHDGATPAPATTTANKASYARALGGRDLTESLLVHGAEEGVVLHTATDPTSYTTTFTLPAGVTAKAATNYGVEFDDAAGKQLLAYGGGFTHDANPSNIYPDGAQTDTVTTLVGQTGNTVTVNVGFDPAFLADPTRVFPVTVDPSYYTNTSSTGDGQDTWVEHDGSTSQYASSELRTGYGFGSAGNTVARTLIEFQIAGLANPNNYVSEAHMRINQFASTQCATTYVNGLGAGFSNATIWSNQPPKDGQPLVSATNLCNGWSSVDLTSVARRWFNNSAPDWGIQMQSNEQASDGWRKFYSGENGSGYAPAIYVTYGPPPAPTATTQTSPAQAGPAGLVTPGQTLNYTTKITNPATDAQTVTLTDPAAAGDLSGVQIQVGSGAKQTCAAAGATCTMTVPGASAPGLKITGLSLPASDTVTVFYTGAATRLASAVCQKVTPTASVAGLAGTTASTLAGTATSVCDSALGLEAYWSFLSRPVGPDGVADVNAANGNLVVQQLDSTAIQGRGHLAYVLRRTYNSQDTTIASLPGSLGGGWQLNFGEAGDTVGDGVSPAGLSVPPLAGLLSPLSITLVDRDGTRHVFTAKLATTNGINISGQRVQIPSGTNWANLPTALGLGAQVVQNAASTGTFQNICVDVPYKAPAGVHLGLWRYIATNQTGSGGCSNLTTANSAVIGFATMRPDRLRSEFDSTGRLLSQMDGAGNEMRYLYSGGLPTAQLGAGASPVNLGPLAYVYEPRTCTSGVNQGVTPSVPATCRSYHFTYAGTNTTTNLPTGGLTSVVDPAGRTTGYAYDNATSVTRHLTQVTNPDGSSEQYAYSNVNGQASCGPTDGQLCVVTDPRGAATTLTYASHPSGGPARVAGITDRRGTATSLSYATDSSSMTSTDNAVNGPVQTRKYSSIDSAGRVGRIQDLDPAGAVLHDTTYTWDTAAATCRTPDPAVDNLLCSTTRNKGASGGAPSTRDVRYNNEGLPLVTTMRNPDDSSQTFTTTDGYHVQMVDTTGTVHHYTDTPTGSSAVSSTSDTGGRIDPTSPASTSVYAVDDHTAALTARGNAASPPGGWQAYETTWKLDAPTTGDGGGFNAQPGTGGVCTGTTGNTGLACEQHSPASDPSPVSCTETDGSTRGCDLTRYTYDTYGAKITMATPAAVKANPAAPATYGYAYYSGGTDLSGHTDRTGWLSSVTDPAGKFVAYGYDAAGNRIRTWDRAATDRAAQPATSYPGTLATPPSSEYTQTLYDSSGTAAAPASDAHGAANPWRYVTSSRDPLGNLTALTVDPNGNITTLRPPRGTAASTASFDSTSAYDPGDLSTSKTTPAGMTSTGYDAFGNKTSTIDGRGNVTATAYDAVNRPTTTRWTRRAGTATAATECTPGTVTTSADAPLPTGRILCSSTVGYDNLDRTTSTTDAAGGQSDTTYDTRGLALSQRVKRTASVYLWTRTNYDADGHTVDVCRPDAFSTSATDAGTCSPSPSMPNATHTDYDSAGHKSADTVWRNDTSPAQALATSYGYDPNGHALTVTDPAGQVTTAAYDTLDRVTDITPPAGSQHGPVHTVYDPAGNKVLTSTAAAGGGAVITATATAFDADNRATDTVTGYAGPTTDPVTIENGARTALATSDGGSGIHTRDVYDQDGNVVTRYSARAFTAPATGTSPDSRFAAQAAYDNADRPTSSSVARYDTADPAFANLSDASSADQGAQCPTGQPGFAATVGVCSTKVAYDADGNRTRVTLPTSTGSDGRYVSYDYTDDNLTAAVHAPSPKLASTMSGSTRAEAVTTTSYDGASRPLTQVDPGLTGDGSDAAQFTTTHGYNLDGTATTLTTPTNPGNAAHPGGPQTTSYSYDNDGQAAGTVDPLGQVASTTYNSDHTTRSTTDTGGNLTAASYSPAGDPRTTVSPNGGTTTYAYSPDHQLLTVDRPADTSGNHYQQSYRYDAAGRKTSDETKQIDSSGTASTPGPQTFTWYAAGKMQSSASRHSLGSAAEVITSCYDASGSTLESIDTPAATGAAGCTSPDGRALPPTAAASAGHLNSSYYLDGELRTADDGTHVTRYGYNASGATTSRRLGTATVAGAVGTSTYRYSDAGQPVNMHDTRAGAGGGDWTRSYDLQARPAAGTMPNGNTVTWAFNPDETLADQTQKTSTGSPVDEHSYTYDQLRRQLTNTVKAQNATDKTDTYTYDTAGRLTSDADSTATTKYGTWDKNNNRTCWGTSCNATPAPADSFTYTPDNRLATTGAKPVSYDNVARRTTDGSSCYTYDGYDRTTAAYAATGTTCAGAPVAGTSPGVTYTYDPLDRQNSRTATPGVADATSGTTTIGYDGTSNRQSTETTTTGTTSWVLDGTNTPTADVTPTATNYLLDDGHGNITSETTAAGALSCLVRYDPFGNNLNTNSTMAPGSPCDQTGTTSTTNAKTTGNDLLFANQRRDSATNKYQLGSRTYDPANAVFTTSDSDRNTAPQAQPGVGTDPLTANTYSYVNGDPINYVDPSGHAAQCDGPCNGGDARLPGSQGYSSSRRFAPQNYGSNQHYASDHDGFYTTWGNPYAPPPMPRKQDCGPFGCTLGGLISDAGSAIKQGAKAVAPFVAAAGTVALCEGGSLGSATPGCLLAGVAVYGGTKSALDCPRGVAVVKCFSDGALTAGVEGAAGGFAGKALIGVAGDTFGPALNGVLARALSRLTDSVASRVAALRGGSMAAEAELAGSGPVSGVLEVSGRVKSVGAFRNYNPRAGAEYVFDPATSRFAVGRPAADSGLKGSPHQQLAESIGADQSGVVGGMLRRGPGGEFITDEMSGHFYQNWTPEIRSQFTDFMQRFGLDVVH